MAAVQATHALEHGMNGDSPPRPSLFLHVGETTEAGSLAIIHLRRDQSMPTILAEQDDDNEGYDEGKVTNTRFGSFPHSTLIGLPWGSQVRASNVDTGSRGRRAAGQKRKREDGLTSSDPSTPVDAEAPKVAKAAESGFIHLLPPTPEIWTMSLPHRTQVVYTPDYSFVLQRLRALPGSQLIEAGAGSGSFSHAAARSVFSGFPSDGKERRGKVWSFEFHEQRCEKLQKEVRDHGLQGVVEVNHRDVYENGFTVVDADGNQQVQATAIFLDLPAPWLALPNLTRKATVRKSRAASQAGVKVKTEPGEDTAASEPGNENGDSSTLPAASGPLASSAPVHICCFLPCIEQVQRTVVALKSLGWQEVSTVEVSARRIEVRRERVGINEEGLRGVNASPANVEEALIKIREAEERTKVFHITSAAAKKKRAGELENDTDELAADGTKGAKLKSKQQRLQDIKDESERRKLYKEGRLIHRPESELKTHTSYLIFAILPREWTDEDEARMQQKWSSTK